MLFLYNFTKCLLFCAYIGGVDLDDVDLRGATMPNGRFHDDGIINS